MDIQKIPIKDVKNLLNNGKKVKVKTLNNQFVDVVKYVEKGILNTYEVILKNGKSIKVSNDHRFFTNVGWLKTKNIIPNKTSILCDDNEYHLVEKINFIGKRKIVDITVNHPDECYFGNGMLNHNTGKSLVAAHVLATVQKRGGVAVYIDTENALSMEFLEAIGVDVKSMIYAPLETIEDIFSAIESIIEHVRKTDSDRLVAIVVDSIAGASTKQEMEADYDKDGYATGKAIIISKALRKITNLIGREKIALIFTNQLRTRLGVMFGDPYCVDPYTTKIKIRYNKIVKEEITLAEFAEKFLGINDFQTPAEYDLLNFNIEVLGKDLKTGNDVYKPIKMFIVKESVYEYYTDGIIKCSKNHRIIENGKEITVEKHPEFKKINAKLNIVDIEVKDIKNYYANGRLNHNTTSGGKAIGFHSSVRIRLKNKGQIKHKTGSREETIGITVHATVSKNRVGPPFRTGEFDVYFDRGIDDTNSWLKILKELKIIKANGSWYSVINEKGEEIRFQSKEWPTLLENEAFKEHVYNQLCNDIIMKYNKSGDKIDPDEIEVTDGVDGE